MRKRLTVLLIILPLCVILHTACFSESRSWDGFSNEPGNVLPTEFTYDHSEDISTYQLSSDLTSHNGYIYYHDGTSFVQYNEKTGRRSYLCPKANCTHKDTDCTFRSCMVDTSLFVKDNKLFFWRDFGDDVKLVMYDITNGKQTALHSMPETEVYAATSIFYFAPYIYYYEITTVGNEGVYQIGDVVLYRQNIETLDIQTICTFDDHKSRFVIADRGDLLILAGSDGISTLSLSSSSDRTILVKKDMLENKTCLSTSCHFKDGYIWFFTYSEDSNDPDGALWKYSLESSELTKIADLNDSVDAFNHSFTSDYIYYRIKREKNIGHFKADNAANSGDIIIDEPNFYRISYDGGEPEEILLEFPDYAATCNITSQFCVDGYYIYARYNNYGPLLKDEYSTDDFSKSLSGLMRIDVRDGSIIYVSGK